jgi:hypothetical protein
MNLQAFSSEVGAGRIQKARCYSSVGGGVSREGLVTPPSGKGVVVRLLPAILIVGLLLLFDDIR